MNRKTAYVFTAARLLRSVIEPMDFGRKRVFIKKKQDRPLTAEMVTEETVLQPVDEVENNADRKIRTQERIKQRPLPPPPVKPTN